MNESTQSTSRPPSRVLITGASGYIGRHLLKRLAQADDFTTRAVTRRDVREVEAVSDDVIRGDLAEQMDWSAAMDDVQFVIHAAGLAHVGDASESTRFRRINTEATLELARQAASAGVRRFIFLSTIGVFGRTSDVALDEAQAPAATSAYAVSKYEAEQGLLEIARQSEMEVVLVRPPMVYGPGAPGNFTRLLGAVQRGWPLPLAAIDNRRSLVGIENLVDFIVLCLRHPAAANEIFHPCDGEDLSTPTLVRLIADGIGKPARLFPIPVIILKVLTGLIGRQAEFESLCGDLRIDDSKIRSLLEWQAPVSMARGIRSAAATDSSRPRDD